MGAMEFTKTFFNLNVETASNIPMNSKEESPTKKDDTDDELDFAVGYPTLDVDEVELDSVYSPTSTSSLPSGSNSSSQIQKDVEAKPKFNSTPIQPSISGKRKRRKGALDNEIDMAIIAELKKPQEPPPVDTDEDSLFLKSLIPQLKRLNPKSKALVKCKIQQIMFQAEFEVNFEEKL